jgi:hypothetical protein
MGRKPEIRLFPVAIHPNDLEFMPAAFNKVCERLGLQCRREDRVTDVVVDAIIEVAAMGERDHDRLCEVRGNGGMSSRARRRDRVCPPLHRRDLQRSPLPRIDPASRRSPTRPLEYVRVAAAVRYLQRDVFIKRSALDWFPAIVARPALLTMPRHRRRRLGGTGGDAGRNKTEVRTNGHPLEISTRFAGREPSQCRGGRPCESCV